MAVMSSEVSLAFFVSLVVVPLLEIGGSMGDNGDASTLNGVNSLEEEVDGTLAGGVGAGSDFQFVTSLLTPPIR